MKYAYEDLGSGQFETLVILLCQELLGLGVQGFAPGPDGGRDAKFEGVAECHPSKTKPWSGTTIVQAKHTNGINKSFSDSDFFSEESKLTVIGKEIPRVKKLREAAALDHYMLFSNRRLSGIADDKIKSHISSQCGIAKASISLCGVEQLELWLKTFSAVPSRARLDLVESPLIVSPDELAEVIEALEEQKNAFKSATDASPSLRTAYEQKNKLNNMSDVYAKEQRRRFLKDTAQIRSFLSAPENEHYLRCYETTVQEFDLKIIAKRKDFQSFDRVMEYLADLLFNRDAILRRNKKLTRAMLFYMYWNCDIGEIADASAE